MNTFFRTEFPDDPCLEYNYFKTMDEPYEEQNKTNTSVCGPLLDATEEIKSLLVARKTQRDEYIFKATSRGKMLLQSEDVYNMGAHCVFTFWNKRPVQYSTSHTVPAELGLLHHYRMDYWKSGRH